MKSHCCGLAFHIYGYIIYQNNQLKKFNYANCVAMLTLVHIFLPLLSLTSFSCSTVIRRWRWICATQWSDSCCGHDCHLHLHPNLCANSLCCEKKSYYEKEKAKESDIRYAIIWCSQKCFLLMCNLCIMHTVNWELLKSKIFLLPKLAF